VRYAAWYGIVVGTLMVAQWTFFLATGNVPELQTEPLRLSFHLAGELLTAVGLLVAGIALHKALPWGRWLYLVSVGMVIYSEIVSPGYFAQQGQWGFVAMFAVLLAGAAGSVVTLVRTDAHGDGTG
jgi:hypothetical protein